MLKYPDPIRGTKLKGILSYKNNQYSEYIGCKIFKACGFETQDVELGYFTDVESGKEKVVVGCKDFTQDGSTLYEIAKLRNQVMVSGDKLDASIENISVIINSSALITDKCGIIDGFWDMFVIDALIGNGDRHFGNWGIIEKDDDIRLAPVYDCGSSLGALLDDGKMDELLKTLNLFKNKEFNATSCYYINGKRIFYHEIFKNPPTELQEAMKRVMPKIDMDKICEIIDDTPEISDTRKEYLKKAIELRYEQMLVPSFKLIAEAP
jgi:hypothetical protein